MDTNVFVYAMDPADPDKQARAQHLLQMHSAQFVVSTQVVLEFYSACTRKLGMQPQLAATALSLLAHIEMVPADRTLVFDAVLLAQEQQLSIFDAAIVCAARRAECSVLLTEDLSAGHSFGELAVMNPFA